MYRENDGRSQKTSRLIVSLVSLGANLQIGIQSTLAAVSLERMRVFLALTQADQAPSPKRPGLCGFAALAGHALSCVPFRSLSVLWKPACSCHMKRESSTDPSTLHWLLQSRVPTHDSRLVRNLSPVAACSVFFFVMLSCQKFQRARPIVMTTFNCLL